MALSNAERQKRWRQRRNSLAKTEAARLVVQDSVMPSRHGDFLIDMLTRTEQGELSDMNYAGLGKLMAALQHAAQLVADEQAKYDGRGLALSISEKWEVALTDVIL